MNIGTISLMIVLAPLIAGVIAGIAGKQIGRSGAHCLTIAAVALSTILSAYLCKYFVLDNAPAYNQAVYTWGISGDFVFQIGFLIDRLSAMMLLAVNFISLVVHVYSIGYMRDDPGYQRFFSYIALFTFAMLMLVTANNFLQLFFGWEGVGLVSYLLIGFWFKRDAAAVGGLKAFLVNRVGDLGFLLGIAAVFNYLGSIDYSTVFAAVPTHVNDTLTLLPGMHSSVITVICILLFIGAMGKSAQVPLHVWLPESMEGPTPISALIHAATMVTAGIYMVARMSPIYEYSPTALSFILVIGATGALFTGILALVQNDIKRVVAYSTLSQLGYMVAALGASAYAAGIFHLFTHACFKALLFLAAGSVIIALHHEQDMRKMGNLWKYMPLTYVTFLIGALSLAAIPPFSGFYSKDAIIAAIQHTSRAGADYAYVCVVIGTFVTALYIFRAFFQVFHTQERMDASSRAHLKESPWVVCLPLLVLAIPSAMLGASLVEHLLYGTDNWFGNTLFVLPDHRQLLASDDHSMFALMREALHELPFWFALSGIAVAWIFFIRFPAWPGVLARRLSWLYSVLVNKYGFDAFNQRVFVRGTRSLSEWLFHVSDEKVIDNVFVNGSGRVVSWSSRLARRIQSGYLYHYALLMILALLAMSLWLVL